MVVAHSGVTGILGESHEERSRARRARRGHGVGPGRADLPHHHRGVGSNDARGAQHQHHRRRRRRRRGGHLRHRVRPGIRRCDSGRHSDLHLRPEGLERQRRRRRPRHRPERRPEPHRHEHALRRCPSGQHDDRGQHQAAGGRAGEPRRRHRRGSLRRHRRRQRRGAGRRRAGRALLQRLRRGVLRLRRDLVHRRLLRAGVRAGLRAERHRPRHQRLRGDDRQPGDRDRPDERGSDRTRAPAPRPRLQRRQ